MTMSMRIASVWMWMVNITVHWVALKSIGKTVFSNAVDAAKYAAEMSDYYDKHYSFGGKQIKKNTVGTFS